MGILRVTDSVGFFSGINPNLRNFLKNCPFSEISEISPEIRNYSEVDSGEKLNDEKN
jgi:hypothetical protein